MQLVRLSWIDCGVHCRDFDAWTRRDEEELRRGAESSKTRETFTCTLDMRGYMSEE